MARWHNMLHGRGRFVVFTDDHQTQNVCRLNNIPKICVQHTNEGVPWIDQIFKRMHASGSSRSIVGSDTVVAFINSDLFLHKFEPMHTLLKLLGHSVRLELMAAPQKPFFKNCTNREI